MITKLQLHVLRSAVFGHVCPSTTEDNALPRWRTSGFLVLIQGMGNTDLKSAVQSAVNFNLPTVDHFFPTCSIFR